MASWREWWSSTKSIISRKVKSRYGRVTHTTDSICSPNRFEDIIIGCRLRVRVIKRLLSPSCQSLWLLAAFYALWPRSGQWYLCSPAFSGQEYHCWQCCWVAISGRHQEQAWDYQVCLILHCSVMAWDSWLSLETPRLWSIYWWSWEKGCHWISKLYLHTCS